MVKRSRVDLNAEEVRGNVADLISMFDRGRGDPWKHNWSYEHDMYRVAVKPGIYKHKVFKESVWAFCSETLKWRLLMPIQNVQSHFDMISGLQRLVGKVSSTVNAAMTRNNIRQTDASALKGQRDFFNSRCHSSLSCKNKKLIIDVFWCTLILFMLI